MAQLHSATSSLACCDNFAQDIETLTAILDDVIMWETYVDSKLPSLVKVVGACQVPAEPDSRVGFLSLCEDQQRVHQSFQCTGAQKQQRNQ